MRLAFAMVALGIVIGLPASAKGQSWQEYRPEGIGFRIEMPGKPKLETRQTKAGKTAYHAVVGLKDMAFLVVYGAKDVADSDSALDAVVKAVAADNKLLNSKKEMIGASPARRILVEDADKDQFEFRIVIADNRLIQATFAGPAGNLLGRRFLDSLAILEPKQP